MTTIDIIKNKSDDIATQIMQKAKKRGYICPFCDNGAGKDGDGITLNPKGNYYKCFKCGFSGSIIDLVGAVNNINLDADIKRAIDICCDYLHIINDYDLNTNYNKSFKSQKATLPKVIDPPTPPPPLEDLSYYFRKCQDMLMKSEPAQTYLKSRGLSLDSITKCGLGFDPNWVHPRSPKMQPTARIIIPRSTICYTARNIDPNGDPSYKAMKTTGNDIFNLKALKSSLDEPIFVTEGEFDCLSIIECKRESISIGGTGGVNELVNYLKANPDVRKHLIITLDNDKAGIDAKDKLVNALKSFYPNYSIASISDGYKDVNEALQGNKPQLMDKIEQVRLQTLRPHNVKEYLLKGFSADIVSQKNIKKTGFENLDTEIDGLYNGLYVLGAVSSLGKTTFIHQLADQMIANGEHVLFFSLEQSRMELVSKSLSRLTAKADQMTAINSLSIRRGFKHDSLSKAYKEYLDDADKLSVIEGNFNCNINTVKDITINYINTNKVSPIVIIDYLQILQPAPDQPPKMSLKETIDINITELKRLSRDYNLTVIAISSVNRGNYLTPIDFESFKETGGIEYTADVVWGLQLQVINDDLFNKTTGTKEKREKLKDAKAESPRKIELVCLKNRYGIASYTVGFKYFPMWDLFLQDDDYNNNNSRKFTKGTIR